MCAPQVTNGWPRHPPLTVDRRSCRQCSHSARPVAAQQDAHVDMRLAAAAAWASNPRAWTLMQPCKVPCNLV
jgi:hypothetical protein